MSVKTDREQEQAARERERAFIAWTRVEHPDQTHQGTDPPRATEVWLRRSGGILLRGPQFERMSGGSPRDGLGIDGQHWTDLVDAVAACRARTHPYGPLPTPVPHVDVRAWKEAPMPAARVGAFLQPEQVDPLRGVLAFLGDVDTSMLDAGPRERLNEAHNVLGNFLDEFDRAS